ncbi:MAG TPA: DEAD/DEAH box helicase, partial [Candidatus Sabulitectum sp.]|nr:DEAD/DEAH box helicase [Candidatus Sabulitectum sp.]
QNSQVTALRKGVDVLVATPGRLLDLIGQGYIHLGSIEMLVLDEVDRMLDMGFINDIRKILGKLPRERQTMFFSATMAGEMKRLADSMLKNPVEVRIEPEKPTLEAIEQRVFYVSRYDKDDLLVSVLGDPSVSKAIVFTQMKHTANKVASKLAKSGIRGTAIHGNKSQNARTRSLDGFKDNRYNVLVATDVAARGLDVDSITHVINYDLPVEAETYVHRIGRTARAGSQGDAISFCTREDKAYLKEIEKLLGKPVPVFSDHEYHCSAAENGPVIPQSSGGSGRRRQQRVRRSH